MVNRFLILIFILHHTVGENKLNFFMDVNDVLELKYDLFLSKEQMVNDLEAETKGPIILHLPTEPEMRPFKDINMGTKGFNLSNIIDVKNLDHHIFYLYK